MTSAGKIFFLIEDIRRLAENGFNPTALLEMEKAAFRQAVMALPGEPHEVIAKEAANCLPKGVKLHALYTQTLSSLTNAPIRSLEEMAGDLQSKAEVIEKAYDKISAEQFASSEEKASMLDALAKDYASLLATAKDLEERSIITVSRSSKLQALSEQPDGPMGAIFQRAEEILESWFSRGKSALSHRESARMSA